MFIHCPFQFVIMASKVANTCNECGKSFGDSSNLKRHMSFIHSTEVNLATCEHCNKEMRVTSMKRHQQNCKINPLAESEEVFTCDVCSLRFPSKKDLEYHKGSLHEKVLQCSQCEKSFKIVKSLKKHEKATYLNK